MSLERLETLRVASVGLLESQIITDSTFCVSAFALRNVFGFSKLCFSKTHTTAFEALNFDHLRFWSIALLCAPCLHDYDELVRTGLQGHHAGASGNGVSNIYTHRGAFINSLQVDSDVSFLTSDGSSKFYNNNYHPSRCSCHGRGFSYASSSTDDEVCWEVDMRCHDYTAFNRNPDFYDTNKMFGMTEGNTQYTTHIVPDVNGIHVGVYYLIGFLGNFTHRFKLVLRSIGKFAVGRVEDVMLRVYPSGGNSDTYCWLFMRRVLVGFLMVGFSCLIGFLLGGEEGEESSDKDGCNNNNGGAFINAGGGRRFLSEGAVAPDSVSQPAVACAGTADYDSGVG